MSFVGKVLVVFQLVLSVLFMALAGAVFSVHTNWKAKYTQAADNYDKATKEISTKTAELDSVKQQTQKTVDDNKAEMTRLRDLVQTQEGQIAALTKKNNEDQQELQTQTALAEDKAKEAEFRKQESDEQRAANRALQASLDDNASKLRQSEDEKFSLQVDFDNLKVKWQEDQERLAYLDNLVRKHKLESDPKVAAKLEEPPPPVEGLVKSIKKDRANQVRLVEISIGSDDGLIVGHKLDVLRTGVNGKPPKFLGVVKVIKIEPDYAVCEVLREDAPPNGIIEVGDNVTTKL